MNDIIRPITDDGTVGYDQFNQLLAKTPRENGGVVDSLIQDVRGKTCEICLRGWEPTAKSMIDQHFWREFDSYVHVTCYIRHVALCERSGFYWFLVNARIPFRNFRQIDGRYWRKDDAWYRPWYAADLCDSKAEEAVARLSGNTVRIEIGWRKRVIAIELIAGGSTHFDWCDAAEKDFTTETVTKDFSPTRILLHAHGSDKAREYIKRLARVGKLAR